MSQAQYTVLRTEPRVLCVLGSILSQNFTIFFVLFIYFEMRSHSVAPAALELGVASAGPGLAVIPVPLLLSLRMSCTGTSSLSHILWLSLPPSSNLTIPEILSDVCGLLHS